MTNVATTPGLNSFPPYAPPVARLSKRVRAVLNLVARFGLVGDEQTMGTYATARFGALPSGLAFVRFPPNITFGRLVAVVNAIAVEHGRSEIYLHPNIWGPERGDNGYTDAELDRYQPGDEDAVPDLEYRVARINPIPYEGADSLLWLCRLAYDNEADEDAERTQVGEVASLIAEYGQQNPGYELDTLDHRDYLVLYALAILEGAEVGQEPFSKGFMRVVLRRVTVGAVSYVGYVFSRDGLAFFDGSRGRAHGWFGVGLSAGFAS